MLGWLWRNEWRFPKWVRKWIFPAYGWRNLLHRTDLVRLPGPASEYHEYDWRMTAAVFTLVSEFVEHELEERVVDWEATGPAALDAWRSMREIRDWWRSGRERAIARAQRIREFWMRWYVGEPAFGTPDKRGMRELTFSEEVLPKTYDDFLCALGEDDWRVFDEFFADRSKIVDADAVRKVSEQTDDFVREQDDKYLRKAVDVRERMWT